MIIDPVTLFWLAILLIIFLVGPWAGFIVLDQEMKKREEEVEGLKRVIFDSEQVIDTLTAERDDAQRRAENDWKLKLLLAACGFSIVDDPSRGGYCLYHRDGRYYCPTAKDEQVQQVQ